MTALHAGRRIAAAMCSRVQDWRRRCWWGVACLGLLVAMRPVQAAAQSASTRMRASGAAPAPAAIEVRDLPVSGFGALSGPVRSFGLNSRAALLAAADSINRAGGIRLADGAVGRFRIDYADDRCAPAEGVALVRRIAASTALVAVGPSCSAVAQAVYDALEPVTSTALAAPPAPGGPPSDGATHAGLRIPVLTDGATKAGLAQRSAWAFRNVPQERELYRALWAWVRRRYPALRSFVGGEEGDFAHSHSTYANIIVPEAVAAGFTRVGEVAWSIADTDFTTAAARIREARADILVLSAHAGTTCGVLRALHRAQVHPRLVVGLTSASSEETLRACAADAEGLLVPTTFAKTTPAARAAAAAVERTGGVADLHSMAAWELLFTLRRVIEQGKVSGRPETLAADREAIRAGFAKLATIDGLLGPVQRLPDRESRKPFVLVRAERGHWRVVARP